MEVADSTALREAARRRDEALRKLRIAIIRMGYGHK